MKKISQILMTLVILLTFNLNLSANELKVNISEDLYKNNNIFIYNVDSKNILFQLRDNDVFNPGSAVKFFTVFTLIKDFNLNYDSSYEYLTEDEESLLREKGYKVSNFLEFEKSYTVKTLLESCLLEDAADSCYVLIKNIGGEAKLLEAINQNINNMKLTNTRVVDVLSSNKNTTSARDLVNFLAQSINLKEFRNLISRKEISLNDKQFQADFYSLTEKLKISEVPNMHFGYYTGNSEQDISLLLVNLGGDLVLSLNRNTGDTHSNKVNITENFALVNSITPTIESANDSKPIIQNNNGINLKSSILELIIFSLICLVAAIIYYQKSKKSI